MNLVFAVVANIISKFSSRNVLLAKFWHHGHIHIWHERWRKERRKSDIHESEYLLQSTLCERYWAYSTVQLHMPIRSALCHMSHMWCNISHLCQYCMHPSSNHPPTLTSCSWLTPTLSFSSLFLHWGHSACAYVALNWNTQSHTSINMN